MPKLVASPTRAGIFDVEQTEERPFGHRVRKGGYIALVWEEPDHTITDRTIAVTRERAFQAMNRLEKGEVTA